MKDLNVPILVVVPIEPEPKPGLVVMCPENPDYYHIIDPLTIIRLEYPFFGIWGPNGLRIFSSSNN